MSKFHVWTQVDNKSFTNVLVEKNFQLFVYKVQGLPDFSEPVYEYLGEKTLDRIVEVAKRQLSFLRELHHLGSDCSINLRLIKNKYNIDLYLVFRCSFDDEETSEYLDNCQKLIESSLPKEYTFSFIDNELPEVANLFNYSKYNECAQILKPEDIYSGETPTVENESGNLVEYPQFTENFYAVPAWISNDNNMEVICDAMMHSDNESMIDICLVPTSYEKSERLWVNENLKRMKEVISGQKIVNPKNKQVIWQGEPVPVIKIPSDNYEKMNKQYEVSRIFLHSIRVFSASGSNVLANALAVNSVKNEAQTFIYKRGSSLFDQICKESLNCTISITKTPFWIRNSEVAPYRAQRFSRLGSLEEVANFFRIPIPKKTGFPGFRLDTGLKNTISDKKSEKEIVLGNYLDDSSGVELPATLDVEQFAKHGLMVGVPGSGKTTAMFNVLNQLWKHKIPFIVLEPAKTEYRALKTLPGMEDVLVFTLGDETISPFRFNPLEVLPGIKLERHISNLQSCFVGAFDLFDPLPLFLEQAIKRTYEKKGWLSTSIGGDPGLETPSLTDLCESAEYIVSNSGFDQKMKMDFQASLLERLRSLTRGSKGRMLNTKKSIPVDDLMNKPVILELDSLNGLEKSLIMMFLLTYVYEYCKVQRNSGSKLKHMLLVEEAHNLIGSSGSKNENRANPKELTLELFINMLAEMRALGEGILIADQLPTAIAPQAVKQTNVKILMRMTAKDDREEIGSTMDLNEAQEKQVVHFKSGHAYVYHEGEDRVRLVRMLNFKEQYDVAEPPLDHELKEMMKYYEEENIELYKGYKDCYLCTNEKCDRKVREQAENFVSNLINDGFESFKNRVDASLNKKVGDVVISSVFDYLYFETIAYSIEMKQRGKEVDHRLPYCIFLNFLYNYKNIWKNFNINENILKSAYNLFLNGNINKYTTRNI